MASGNIGGDVRVSLNVCLNSYDYFNIYGRLYVCLNSYDLTLGSCRMPKEHSSQRPERASGGSGMPDSSQVQTEQASLRSQSDRAHGAFGLPAAVSLGPLQPPVSLEFLSF